MNWLLELDIGFYTMAGEIPEMILSNENSQLSLNVILTNGRQHAVNILSNDNSLLFLNLLLTNAGWHAGDDSVFCLQKTYI